MKIFLIGPGGVGKSTCGKILAKELECRFIDLDLEFCEQIENIGTYIKSKGYRPYCYANSELFYKLLDDLPENYVFALSSGFLVHESFDELTGKHVRTLGEVGTSVLLLPSQSLEESTAIVVERQLKRGFGLERERETKKFERRFHEYQKHSDIKIFSIDEPEEIVKNIIRLIKQ